MSININILVI